MCDAVTVREEARSALEHQLRRQLRVRVRTVEIACRGARYTAESPSAHVPPRYPPRKFAGMRLASLTLTRAQLTQAQARAQLAGSTSRGMSSLANERTVEALRRHLPSSTGRLLEIGSGTGSNLTALALSFRDWHIQPSDIDASLLPKIATAAEQWSNVAAPVRIDAAAPADDWPVEPSFDCIVAVNVCHYASPQATRGLVRTRPPITSPHTRD